MGYLFDPDNWEWLTTDNNLRFLLEGFLVNLEIAAIAIVFSLAVGLLLALARLAKLKPLSVVAGVWIDVWRNLPLIFIILYLALALPAPWKDFYERNVPDFFPEALAVQASTNTPALPYSAAALQRLIQELPAIGSGLGLTQERTLTALGATDPDRAIGLLMSSELHREL